MRIWLAVPVSGHDQSISYHVCLPGRTGQRHVCDVNIELLIYVPRYSPHAHHAAEVVVRLLVDLHHVRDVPDSKPQHDCGTARWVFRDSLKW
jgi:hypothetical protein